MIVARTIWQLPWSVSRYLRSISRQRRFSVFVITLNFKSRINSTLSPWLSCEPLLSRVYSIVQKAWFGVSELQIILSTNWGGFRLDRGSVPLRQLNEHPFNKGKFGILSSWVLDALFTNGETFGAWESRLSMKYSNPNKILMAFYYEQAQLPIRLELKLW